MLLHPRPLRSDTSQSPWNHLWIQIKKKDTPEGFTALDVASEPAVPWLQFPSGLCFLVLSLLLHLLCLTLLDPVHPDPAQGFQKYVLHLVLFPLRVQSLASPPDAQLGDGLIPLDWLPWRIFEEGSIFCTPLRSQLWVDWYNDFGSHLSFPCFWSVLILKNIAHGSDLWSLERAKPSKIPFCVRRNYLDGIVELADQPWDLVIWTS